MLKSSPLKWTFWRFFSARIKIFQIFMSILNWEVNSFSNFPSFFLVMTHNYPVNFKLIYFLLWIKGSQESPNFWDFQVLWWKFVKLVMSFLKAQVSFPSNFASIFSATKHNSSVIFYPKHYILWSKAVYQSVNFWDFQGLESEFVKFFMSVLKRKVNSSSDFLAFFSVIRHNSSVSI